MATIKQITAQYIEFISREVIDKFGGSYQNYETMGKLWRQKMGYHPAIEEFILFKTKLFLRLLDDRVKNNFNVMYKVCYNISEHLSKYLVKKSSDISREMVTDSILKKIFFDSNMFVTRFKRVYKKPIDLSNTKYVTYNPGVVAMYKSINSK